MTFETRALTPETWPAFARLVEAHNGVWGGCWCLAFHAGNKGHGDVAARCAAKKAMVAEGRTHSALVLEDGECLGWAQYGRPEELPAIKNLKAYNAGLVAVPDWRITCLFVGRAHRKRGVAEAGVAGALALIAEAGSGVVEAYPEDVAGRKVSGSFLWNGTLAMFERMGFARERKIGKHKWVVRREVVPD
ncbi:MAG: GNAT family N-acetyltransferase [Pseudomonadota bacterium]